MASLSSIISMMNHPLAPPYLLFFLPLHCQSNQLQPLARILVGSSTVKSCLTLLQTTIPTAACCNLFGTPASIPVPTTLVTPADLPTLETPRFVLLSADTGNNKLLEYSADCYPLFSNTQLCNLILRIITLVSVPAPIIHSPRMAAVLASGSSVSCGHSYFGSLNVLDA
jgi:hypothetical protein